MNKDSGTYAFTVAGHLDPTWSEWLGGLTITPTTEGTTVLRGFVRDQAALYGLVLRLRDLGLSLLSLERLPQIES